MNKYHNHNIDVIGLNLNIQTYLRHTYFMKLQIICIEIRFLVRKLIPFVHNSKWINFKNNRLHNFPSKHIEHSHKYAYFICCIITNNVQFFSWLNLNYEIMYEFKTYHLILNLQFSEDVWNSIKFYTESNYHKKSHICHIKSLLIPHTMKYEYYSVFKYKCTTL